MNLLHFTSKNVSVEQKRLQCLQQAQYLERTLRRKNVKAEELYDFLQPKIPLMPQETSEFFSTNEFYLKNQHKYIR